MIFGQTYAFAHDGVTVTVVATGTDSGGWVWFCFVEPETPIGAARRCYATSDAALARGAIAAKALLTRRARRACGQEALRG